MFRSNALAVENMNLMLLTRTTFHRERSELKAIALENIEFISVTDTVFQELRS